MITFSPAPTCFRCTLSIPTWLCVPFLHFNPLSSIVLPIYSWVWDHPLGLGWPSRSHISKEKWYSLSMRLPIAKAPPLGMGHCIYFLSSCWWCIWLELLFVFWMLPLALWAHRCHFTAVSRKQVQSSPLSLTISPCLYYHCFWDED